MPEGEAEALEFGWVPEACGATDDELGEAFPSLELGVGEVSEVAALPVPWASF